MIILVSPEQSLKAFSPIDKTLPGIVILVSPEQLLKAPPSIVTMSSGIDIFDTL